AGCRLVAGDLSDQNALTDAMRGCDAVFHVAAIYKVGIPASQRAEMFEANVRGTERVLDAAVAAAARRIVYVSTVNVFGNTRGDVVEETHQRDLNEGFLSVYDETKYLAHQVALDRIATGAPILIAQPGGVYGPGDTSELGNLIDQVRRGRLRVLVFPKLGFSLAHVEDIAEGILLVHDKGEIGETYVLGGELSTVANVVEKIAQLSGRKPPKAELPVRVMRMVAPLGPVIGKLTGIPPNLREAITAADGVTYWASDAKARRELGYSPRDLEQGLRQTLAADSPR
ncbi:MAG: NAD-dependent epimerase/dehydratase family protein, partial [Actinomycetota bacterium]|nr:NAD-dependent epimerase/dehydratase family protein [Actinomycetota bacterium]